MCFTSAKNYTDIHLYLNNSELIYEVGDQIILPGTAAYANPMNTVIVKSTTYYNVTSNNLQYNFRI